MVYIYGLHWVYRVQLACIVYGVCIVILDNSMAYAVLAYH